MLILGRTGLARAGPGRTLFCTGMLDKQPREEAIRKRMERSSMVTKDVPPTAAGTHQNGNIRSFYFYF